MGVWNFGKREYADYYGVVSGKVYSRSRSLFLEILPTDEKNNDRIYYEGGYYKINEVMYNKHNKKIVSFYVEEYLGSASTGEPCQGKIKMHFIDNDHIWLEVDYTDKKYPASPDFSTGDFPGKKVIFWRGEYIGEYDDPKTQEYIEQISNMVH
jgi:hypothetical protein